MSLSAEGIFYILKDTGILPVVCLKNEEELRTFTEALLLTPVRCIEITMRHPYSYEAIQFIKKTHPDFIVGAGTIVDTDMLNRVIELGVDFCVSPGFDEEVVSEAKRKNIAFIPGCMTPSDFLKARKFNINTVKLFPAECSGGVKALKLYADAFSGMSFLPTGGINLDNYREYLSCKNVVACGGSFMIPKEKLRMNDSKGISDTVNSCMEAIKEVRK